ncbi:MAG: DUF4172 domain-containing protein [Rickettsiales bacterium]|jgi:Fic family protein|nr:DUF4172 domain-containing protein [Rickettsiales bacterium]
MYVGPDTVVWEHPEWPNFRYDRDVIEPMVESSVAKNQAFLQNIDRKYGIKTQDEVMLSSTTNEIMHSSQIEGVSLTYKDVLDRVSRSLGLNFMKGFGGYEEKSKPQDVVDIIVDAHMNHGDPLTEERLKGWHRKLFPGGSMVSGIQKIEVGRLRRGSMTIVSGRYEEFIEYNAPPAERVPGMVSDFLDWFNSKNSYWSSWLLNGAEAHLRFVLIHPFDDGNGRISRTISVMSLARMNNSRNCFYPMSEQFCSRRSEYYKALSSTQNDAMDMTEWLKYYLASFDRSIDALEHRFKALEAVADFWNLLRSLDLSDAERGFINDLLNDVILYPKRSLQNVTVKSIGKRMKVPDPEKEYEKLRSMGLDAAVREFHSRKI